MIIGRRIEALDSIRGLASFSVVIDHCLITFPVFYRILLHDRTVTGLPYFLGFTPFHMLWAGHEAVILFYVLSGFVLSLPYLADQGPSFAGYLVKRFFRIYIPYIFAVSVSMLLIEWLSPVDRSGFSEWFSGMWAEPVTFRTVVDMVLMLGESNHNIDTSTWSLVHELRVSLVFPFLAMLVRRVNFKGVLVVGFVMSLAFMFGHRIVPLPQSLYDSGYYASFFVLGSLLAKHRTDLATWLVGLGRGGKAVLLAGALFSYVWVWIVPPNRWLTNVFVGDWAVAIGTSALISAATADGLVSRVLINRHLTWLGQISYSLYLVHPIVLLVMVHTTGGRVPAWLAVASVPVLSLVAAAVVYRFVESPAQQLGKLAASAVTAKTLPKLTG